MSARIAYQCAGCAATFDLETDEPSVSTEVKTAVRWCPACVDQEAAERGVSRDVVVEMRRRAGQAT